MQLLCPRCQSAFAGSSTCPRCGGRLISPQEAHVLSAKRKHAPLRGPEPTAAGRVLVGVLVALGGYVGLREWAAAWLAATGADGGDWWTGDTGGWATILVRGL